MTRSFSPSLPCVSSSLHRLGSLWGALTYKSTLALATTAATLLLPTLSQAQESVRPSLAGSMASQARQASTAPFVYNLKAGPVIFDLRGGFSTEFNDNVNLSDHDPKADFILRPQIAVNSFWQVTPLNALRLDLGFSYATYLNNSSVNAKTVLISPNSQLSFDIFVGDFRINLHDRFSILQDPIDNASLSNVADYTRFQNAAGLSVLWDLNDVKIVLGYDHYTFAAISSDFKFLNRSEEQFNSSVAFSLTDSLSVGLDAGAAIIDFTDDINNDGVSYQVGPFVETQFSTYLKLRLSAGYQAMNFDTGGRNNDQSDSSSPFAVVTLAHRLNPFITESLSAGYETRLGLTTNSAQITFVRYQNTWRVNPLIAVNFEGFFEDSNESPGTGSEHSERYGAGLSTSYQLTQKLLVGLRYEFTYKDSDLADRNYTQNRVSLTLDYNF